MRRASLFAAVRFALLAAIPLVPTPAHAAWPNSPFTNLPVCTSAGNQQNPQIVGDGAGGAITTWYDLRSGLSYDIYAQHVLASGAVDPAWPANGRALCTLNGDQWEPQLVGDGAGGAIITWYDGRVAGNDIYAQHVLASGAVDPAWPANGRALCTATGDQTNPQLLADGSGGAIATWHDNRGATGYDIYAQHVLASGAVDPAWPADGRAVCTATTDQTFAQIVTDGAGGAIVAWQDARSVNIDIYAQHVLASGAVDAAWPVNGRALCTAAGDQNSLRLLADGAGGAIADWQDARTGTFDIYAQHVLPSDAVNSNWPLNGRALCAATGDQIGPRLVTDGAAGAIVTWYDSRTGTPDIYAQHVLASGTVDAAWPVDGRALCTASSAQTDPQIAVDGAGGTLVTWQDSRNGSYDVYAMHVLASGAVDPLWPVNGRALNTAGGNQIGPQLVADAAGNAIVTWYDSRTTVNYDIYAQRVGRYGYLGTPEAEITAVSDVPNDQGGLVKVSWNASYLDLAADPELDQYDVLRSVPPNVAATRTARGARIRTMGGDAPAPEPGDLLVTASAGVSYYWEFLTSITALHYLSGYSYVAATLGDSVAGSNPPTAFMVVARNTPGTMYWLSTARTGYSVDDLAPAAPAPFTGQYSAGTTQLHWNRNAEADLAGYRLYRGASAGFLPGPGSLVAALPDTGYADVAGMPQYYKLTAVDEHGNESPVALLLPSGTTDVDGGVAPRELSLAAPWPNPAGAQTTLRYTLPRAGLARLAVFDAAGRLVRELAAGTHEPGEQAATWDLRDGSGHAVGAGLYFARLEAGGMVRVRRIAVAR